MRPSPRHRLIGLAIALSLGSTVALPISAPASASLIGEVVPPVTVKVGQLLTVETAPTPKVEVPGVATVQAPAPRVEVPRVEVPVPPVTSPSAPPVTTPSLPTSGAPVGQTPGVPTSLGESNGPSSGAGGRAAGTGASPSASAGSNQTATGNAQRAQTGRVTPALGRPRHASARGATAPRGAQTKTADPSAARVTGASAPAVRTASSPGKPARSSGRDSSRNTSSGNPLEQIGRQIPFPAPVPDWSKPIILLLLLLAIWFAARSRLAALRAQRLERQRAVLLGDLDSLRAAPVPEIPARLGDLSVSVAYRPADGPAAGGDFYDLFVLEPGKVAIILGDVAGHGRGALMPAAPAAGGPPPATRGARTGGRGSSPAPRCRLPARSWPSRGRCSSRPSSS